MLLCIVPKGSGNKRCQGCQWTKGAQGVRGQKVLRVSVDKRCPGCQWTKGAKGVRGQKVPRVPEFKRCQECQGTKGAKVAWVKSSEGLLGDRVFSRTLSKTSLTPEEGPSCYL